MVCSGKELLSCVFITLTPQHIELLSNHLITDVKLYIFEKRFNSESAEKIRGYAKCLNEL